MENLFIIKLIGWSCLFWGFWNIIAKNRKENIPLILFMGGTIAVLACLWVENDIIYNLLDPFVC